jgi:hypothetical protein
MEEALQQRTYRDALAGKRMAQREVVKWILKREAWLAKHAPKASSRPIQQLASPDPDNADAALLLLGIAAPNPARADWNTGRIHLLLEPWAVQAALRRRRGGNRLEQRERDDIRRCTREPDGIRFTKGQSGNPTGRPRGRHREAPYEAVLGQPVTVREGGTTRRVTAAEAFLLQLTKSGLEGVGAAARASLAMIEQARQRHGVGQRKIDTIILVAVAPGSVTSGLERLRMAKKLDPYRETARMALEPRIVQAALARLSQPLSPADQQVVVKATRAPDKVQWPEWWSEFP